MNKKILSLLVLFIITITSYNNVYSQKNESCLFKNPLCFYNSDILSYLQILHKNQQFDKMCDFIYGPISDPKSKKKLIKKLSSVNFGYSLKRVGIRKITNTSWSITYQRTLLGTNENFIINCRLINEKCKMYIDNSVWKTLFKD
jgi:hypothetical protein